MSYTPMLSGEGVALLDPDPASISLIDMSMGLGKINRYLGQFDATHYSVAEHCVIMARQAPPAIALYFLLHDGHEYVTGDITHPVKQLFPGIADLEKGIQAAIYTALNIDPPAKELERLIYAYDMRMRATEKLLLGIDEAAEWPELEGLEPFGCRLPCWAPDRAAQEWMEAFTVFRSAYIRHRRNK